MAITAPAVTSFMSTIVAVMDRAGFSANTDNLVLVEPERTRLLWIPRDLWCRTHGSRINDAFRRGGHALLVTALREHELEADNALVLSREATEAALADVAVVVPVFVRMRFAYPLSPTAPIEDGSKEVVFNPPAEALRGERIHQWIGARGDASDLHRIERQKILVRRLLEKRFDFRRALADPSWYRLYGDGALDDLSEVARTWRLETFADVVPATIDGRMVLVRRTPAADI
jgi:hypothetical protein